MDDINEKKKSHKLLIFFIVLIILGAGIFGIVKYVQYEQSKHEVDGFGTTQGNTDGNTKLFKRSANNNDVTISSDLDLSSLGGKYTIRPQYDIDGLEITVNYLDKNKKIIDSYVKRLGNVKKGVQVSFSVSLLDMGISTAWNAKYESISVTGGTVSYFA